MASEDPLFQGKLTPQGVKILEYPVYKIVQLGAGRWNVLCRAYGDSGTQPSEGACRDWVRRHIDHYVRLEELTAVQNKLDQVEKHIKALGYNSIEEFAIDHTGD